MKTKSGKKVPAAALLLILGLILVIFRNAAPEFILRIVAAGLMVVAAAGIFLAVRDKEARKSTRIGRVLLQGLLIALGIAILVKTSFFASFFKYVLGGIMIFFGLKDMIPAIKNKLGLLKILLGLLAIILGVVLFFIPAQALTLLSGLALIYCGAVSVFGGKKPAQGRNKS